MRPWKRRIYTFFTDNANAIATWKHPTWSCYKDINVIYEALDHLRQGWYGPGIRGWEEDCGIHTRNFGWKKLMMIGHIGRSWSGGHVFFNMDYPTWVVDASVDLDDLQMPFEVAGITAAGLVVVSIGTLVCCRAGYLMRTEKNPTPTDTVPDPAVVGQPVEQPVDQVMKQASV